MEPFTVVVTPGRIASLNAQVGPDLYGAAGGIEFATPLVVQAVDAFGNNLSNESITWTDDAGGRFVDLQGLGIAAAWDGLAAKVLDAADPTQVQDLVQISRPFLPVQASYIPPYSATLATVYAAAGEAKQEFHVHMSAGERYYLAAKMDRDVFTDGVTGTWFSSPVAATIFRLLPGGWTPVRPNDVDVSEALVTATTYRGSDGAELDSRSTAGSLTFDGSGRVLIRPMYLVDGDTQSTQIEASVHDANGDKVCCSDRWEAPARASRVKLGFTRVSTVLDHIPIDGSTPARTTDQALRVSIVNPSEQPVYLRVGNANGLLVTQMAPNDPALGAAPIAGLLAAPNGTSHYTLALAGAGYAPDVPTSRPAPGAASFEVWGYGKAETSDALRPELLSQSASVSQPMAEWPNLSGDSIGTAWVRFVGGWNCTYFIVDQMLDCYSEADPNETFRRGHTGDPSTPYSGYYANKGAVVKDSLGAEHVLEVEDKSCFNQACAQCFEDHGTIPIGTYSIGEGFLDPVRPTITYRLNVLDQTCDPAGTAQWAKHVRDGLLIHHGDPPPSNWSTGCLIIPDAVGRDTLNRFGGGILKVKGKSDGANPPKDVFVASSCSDANLGRGKVVVPADFGNQCKGLGPK